MIGFIFTLVSLIVAVKWAFFDAAKEDWWKHVWWLSDDHKRRLEEKSKSSKKGAKTAFSFCPASLQPYPFEFLPPIPRPGVPRGSGCGGSSGVRRR